MWYYRPQHRKYPWDAATREIHEHYQHRRAYRTLILNWIKTLAELHMNWLVALTVFLVGLVTFLIARSV